MNKQNDHVNREARKMSSVRARARYVIPSDTHGFIGRIFDLSIIGLHFDSYDELAKYPDCKYAIDVNDWLVGLVRRVESLNLAGNMIWLNPIPPSWNKMPISRHEWLTVAMDVFLLRYVSVVDCALLLTNEVYGFGLTPEKCTLRNLNKCGLPDELKQHFSEMLDQQEALRLERNRRIHHGNERPFTQDDVTFKIASMFEHNGSGFTGRDQLGRKINVEHSFKEALNELQKDFNRSTKILVKHLDKLYDFLGAKFEKRFSPLIAGAKHGLNAKSQTRTLDKSNEA